MLESWWDAGSRGDLVDDTALLKAAESKAQAKVSARRVSIEGPAKTVFAVDTTPGAVAVVVQHATDTRGGQTTILQGVSLPVAVTVWFDSFGSITKTQTWFPVSQGESGTGPENGELQIGVWAGADLRELVMLDPGYPVKIRDGYLKPANSNSDDLLRRTEMRTVEFADEGYSTVTPKIAVLPGTAEFRLVQDDPLDNFPFAQGHKYDWLTITEDASPGYLSFEGHGGTRDLKVHPWPAAYDRARIATKKARLWTQKRVSFDVRLWGLPLQAKLPDGERLLFRNLLFGEAYVAHVRSPAGEVVSTRCTTPGSVDTASCRLPGGLGRLFVTDDPFRWRVGDHEWRLGREVSNDYTRAAIIPLRAVVRVLPYSGDPFVLFDG
jgi:hypothetical protein